MQTVIGIDEAGRGPLAGPVSVACVAIHSLDVQEAFPIVRDSKKLSPKKREVWFSEIVRLQKEGALSYTSQLVSERTIDLKGITHAIAQGIFDALKSVNMPKDTQILLDGGLKAPQEFIHQKTIIKGDEKELAIALASIVAKVTRDKYMVELAQKYPEYGFEVHKGYGTKKHIQVLLKRGLSPIHRKTFCRRFVSSRFDLTENTRP
ncbi:MAG: ribonuclease HII [Candidatus Campbellbacteria bacterium]|nr:ribonuclease HII [Candidatus Campbellbacteria bacterium]